MLSDTQKRLLLKSRGDQWADPSYFPELQEDIQHLSLVSKAARVLPEFPTDTPGNDSTAQRPKDETFGQFEVVWDRRIGQARELARFLVPHGTYAIIRNIDQYVSLSSLFSDSYATDSENWGRPFRATDEGLILRWHLRTEHIPKYGYPVNIGGWFPVQNLPGLPYKDFGVWDDLRHAWGLPDKLHYPVDGGLVLRFFVEVRAAPFWMG